MSPLQAYLVIIKLVVKLHNKIQIFPQRKN